QQWLATGREGEVLARARHEDGVRVLSRADALWALALHCILDRRGDIPERHLDALRRYGADEPVHAAAERLVTQTKLRRRPLRLARGLAARRLTPLLKPFAARGVAIALL